MKEKGVIVQMENTKILKSDFFKKYGTILGLIGICVVFSILSPHFATTRNVLTVLRQIALLMILSCGLTVVMITTRIDLSLGQAISFLGIVVAALMVDKGMSITAAVIITIILGAFVGFLNGFAIAYLGIKDFIATLAIGFLASGINQSYTRGHPISGLPKNFGIFGEWFSFGIPNAIFIMAIVAVLIFILLKYTRFGRYVYAIGGNEEAARLSGVKTKLYLMLSFVISGIACAITAIVLTSRLGSAHPLAGDAMLMDAIAAVFLGSTTLKEGEPHLLGTFIGVLIMGVLGNGLTLLNVPYYYQDIAKGLVILLAVASTSVQRMEKA